METIKINLSLYQHSLLIQIRFVDIDKAGQVNNSTLLSYFEIGRLEFLIEIIGRENDWDRRGIVIARSEIDFLEPVYIQDKTKVYSRVAELGN